MDKPIIGSGSALRVDYPDAASRAVGGHLRYAPKRQAFVHPETEQNHDGMQNCFRRSFDMRYRRLYPRNRSATRLVPQVCQSPANGQADRDERGNKETRGSRLTGSDATGSAKASSIAMRISAASRRRRLESFSRQRRSTKRMPEGIAAGNACQSGSPFRIPASVSVTVSASKILLPVKHSYRMQPNAHMSAACRQLCP